MRSTVSHVPQADAVPHELPAPQPESHELAPQGLQLDAQGAEQHELTLLPQQLPACADAVMATAAASDKNKRILSTPPKTFHGAPTMKAFRHASKGLLINTLPILFCDTFACHQIASFNAIDAPDQHDPP